MVPEGNLVRPSKPPRQIIGWLARLDAGHTATITRRPITVPLDDTPVEAASRLAHYGDFTKLNNRWNGSNSSTTHRRLQADTTEWEHSHTLYRAARASWPVVPYAVFIEMLATRRAGRIIGDFGCGEALLGKALQGRHTVWSFDHIAIDDTVIACDITRVPLDDGSLDVAVFSLSLIRSTQPTTSERPIGSSTTADNSFIAEATSRISDPFKYRIEQLGFDVASIKQHDRFTFITAVRADRRPGT